MIVWVERDGYGTAPSDRDDGWSGYLHKGKPDGKMWRRLVEWFPTLEIESRRTAVRQELRHAHFLHAQIFLPFFFNTNVTVLAGKKVSN